MRQHESDHLANAVAARAWQANVATRSAWRSRDIDEQVEFGRWLRRNIPDRIDTSGTPEDTATAITAWIDRHLDDNGIPAS